MLHRTLVDTLKMFGCPELDCRYARYCYRVRDGVVRWNAGEGPRPSRAFVSEFCWSENWRAAVDDDKRSDWRYSSHPNQIKTVLSDLLRIDSSRGADRARLYPVLPSGATFYARRRGLWLLEADTVKLAKDRSAGRRHGPRPPHARGRRGRARRVLGLDGGEQPIGHTPHPAKEVTHVLRPARR